MKKFYLVFTMAILAVSGVTAQSLDDIFNKAVSGVKNETKTEENENALGNILGALLGDADKLKAEDLVGTWNYEGISCVLESEQALANIGGALAASTLEEKIDTYLGKIGVAKGSSSFTFNSDNTCVIKLGGFTLNATYKLDPEKKTIDFSFLKNKMKIKSQVSYQVSDLNIVFNADKLLALIKKLTSYFSKDASSEEKKQISTISQTMSTLGSVLEAYDGMMLGAKMSRGTAVSSSETTSSATTTSATTSSSESTSTSSTKSSNGILSGLKKLFK
jgi:hypothetical protein